MDFPVDSLIDLQTNKKIKEMIENLKEYVGLKLISLSLISDRYPFYIGCNKEFPISMFGLYHLTSWHGDKKSEQCHVKQNCNLYI